MNTFNKLLKLTAYMVVIAELLRKGWAKASVMVERGLSWRIE
jgi:hypothetical protein